MNETNSTDTAFTERQFDAVYPRGIEHHFWSLSRNYILADVLRAQQLSKSKILEIGCGRGVVVGFLRSRGHDCFGVELADISLDQDLSPYIKTGTDALSLPLDFRESFEVILLLDTIEHIENPVQFLKALSEAYPNVRHFIFTVPAQSELWSNYDEHYGHFRRYDIASMNHTIETSNLVTTRISYFFHSLYYPTRFLIKVRKHRSIKWHTPSRLMRLVHWALAKYFYLEYLVWPATARGTSLMVVAGRKIYQPNSI